MKAGDEMRAYAMNRPANNQTDRFGRKALILLPAALGLGFCLLNATGAELLCLTRGCGIYADYSLAGISVNLLGAIGFALILLLALLAPKRPLYKLLLLWVLAAGLLIDTLFLAWQALFWPCTSCLVVALLLALCVLGARQVCPGFRNGFVRLLLILWFVALIPVAVAAGKELLLQPWPIQGPPEAPIAVYFSPTCPACETAVLELLELPALRDQVGYFPVAKNSEDLHRLIWYTARGDGQDLRQLFAPVPQHQLQASADLRWQLARNKMRLAAMGVDSVPLVLSSQLLKAAVPTGKIPVWDGSGFSLDPAERFTPVQKCSATSEAEDDCL